MIVFPADGCSQVVDPDKGILALPPDAPQWFAWLASTNTLTFQGRHGSFTPTRRMRPGKRVQRWTVSRCLQSRSCTLSAGMTLTLTAARLEGLAHQLLTRFAPLETEPFPRTLGLGFPKRRATGVSVQARTSRCWPLPTLRICEPELCAEMEEHGYVSLDQLRDV
jgi:hypothetical protein